MRTYIKSLEPYERKLKKAKKTGMTVTVSGMSGCGKSTLSVEIAKVFRLRLVTAGDIFRKVAKHKGIPLERLTKIRKKELDYKIDRETLRNAAKGRVVINGRLAGYVAGDYSDCRIFLQCDLRERARRIAGRDKIKFSEALKKTRNRDREDAKKYKKLYGINLNSKKIYTFIIDTNKYNIPQMKKAAINRIKSILKRR